MRLREGSLGSNDALGDGRLRDEERARDLARLETAKRAERERDPRLDPEGGMTAREDEAEALVGNRGLVLHGLGLEAREQLRLALERPVAANPVDGPVSRHRHEPSGRICRHPVSRPALECGRDRILEGVLGEVEVAEDADQGGEHPAVVLAEQCGDGVYWAGTPMGTSGRTSIVPPRADGLFAAHSIASSSEPTSIR